MTRQEKYPDTEYFTFDNVNPKNRFGSDCVVRAISLALNQSWETTVREMTELGIKKGLVLNDKELYPLYLKEKGFKEMKEPRDLDNQKVSVVGFINWYCKHDTIVANVGSHHVVCIKNHKIHDTWNSSYSKMHKYWVK